eukprot:g44408.t1
MTQTGDKGTLIWRCNLFDDCTEQGLEWQGRNPCSLKASAMGELKKATAQAGVLVIEGTQDELLEALVNFLKSKKGRGGSQHQGDSGGSGSSSSSSNGQGGLPSPQEVATEVLRLGEEEAWLDILNLATPSNQRLTTSSPVAQMRKAYLKLSLVIHPDKLQGFEQATKSFQLLVKALDELSRPKEEVEEEEPRYSKQEAQPLHKISRGNVGCVRTNVRCPRCRTPWGGRDLEGNPPYAYTLLMQGLRSYVCATCLCEFGCMTAIHDCPRCKKPFEYSPEDYNRKITCGRDTCKGKEFGFWLYDISDRVMKEVRATLKEEAVARQRKRAAKLARRKRGQARGAADSDEVEERSFTLGLSDSCPRCGKDFSENSDMDEHEKTLHLMSCTDSDKIQTHQKKKARAKEEAERKENLHHAQEDAGAKAAWQALGGRKEQLWLLSASHLRAMVLEAAAITGEVMDKEELEDLEQDELIARLTSLRDFPSAGTAGGPLLLEGKKRRGASRSSLTADSLPPNLQALSIQELKAVAAAHGLVIRSKHKAEIIEEMEREAYSGVDDELATARPALLAPAKRAKPKPKPKAEARPLLLAAPEAADDDENVSVSDQNNSSSDSEEPLKKKRKKPAPTKKRASTKKKKIANKKKKARKDSWVDDDEDENSDSEWEP